MSSQLKQKNHEKTRKPLKLKNTINSSVLHKDSLYTRYMVHYKEFNIQVTVFHKDNFKAILSFWDF